MNFWNAFDSLFSNFGNLTWQMVVMWGIGALLIYLAIAKKMEPSLLLPMGFGAVLVNLPLSGAITQGDTEGPISALFEAGMSNELFPLLLFIGIGAMIDFGPLLEKPWLMLFGAAAQFGIFFYAVPGRFLLRPEGCCFDCSHRCSRWSHSHLCGQHAWLPLSGRDHGSCLQLYGDGPHCSAARGPSADYPEGTQYPNAL